MDEGKKPVWKRWWFWVIAFVVLAAIGSLGGNNKSQETATTDSSKPVIKQIKEKKVTKFDWTTATITEGNVKTALSEKRGTHALSEDANFIKDITLIEIKDNAAIPGNKDVYISFKDSGDSWDETDFVKRMGGTAIFTGSVLYQNKSVGDVHVIALTDIQDQYGKNTPEEAVKIVLTKELANKVNWKGLADRHLTDPGNIYNLSGDYYIHPGILKNVKTSEVNLQ